MARPYHGFQDFWLVEYVLDETLPIFCVIRE